MKVILTVGHELSGFEQVHQTLTSAGVAQAQPSKRDALSIKTLQQNMLTALDVDSAAAAYQLKPGKMWQDLAADVFLGNLQQKIWGHVDTHTLWLLDFWRTLDTQTHFVLVYNSPTQVIANALARDSSPQTIGAVLSKWKSDNTELLRFYHRNKDRALLVHINSIANASANAFIQSVNQSFGVSLSDKLQQAAADEQASELATLIADQAILQHADLVDCYLELESAADLPAEADGSNNISVEKACAEFAALKTASFNNTQLQIEIKAAQEKSVAAAQVQADFEQRNLLMSGELEALTSERDLILLQLHQVQEELEKVYWTQKSIVQENGEFKLSIEAASKENAQLQQAHAKLVKTEAEKTQEIQQLKEKTIQQEKSIAALSGVKAAHEKLIVSNKALTEKITQLEKSLSLLSSVNVEHEKLTVINRKLAEKIEQLEKTISSLSDINVEHEKLTVTNKTLTEKINQLESSLSLLSSVNVEHEKLTAINGKLTEKNEQLEKTISSLSDINVEHEKLTVTNKTLTEKINQLENSLSLLSGVNVEHEKLTVTNRKLTEKIEQLEKTISSQVVVSATQGKLEQANTTLKEENEYLLSHLHQVQEKLDDYYLKYQALTTGEIPEKRTSDSFVSSFWKKHQPDQIAIDLRTDFLGDNWYDPEQDGTWAGPALKSTLKIPALSQGEYAITFVVADAMAVDIVSTMAISLNGVPLTLNIDQLNYPVNVTAHINTDLLPHDSVWLFELSFAKNVSPADCDSNNHDHRFLAIKLQQLILNLKMKSSGGSTAKSLAAPVVAVPAKIRSQVIVKMNEPIKGTNWHDAEHDGRWAGPGTLSTVIIPSLTSGQYDINLNIVDTIEPDVLAGMELLINGCPVPLNFDWSQFPAPITARFSSEQIKPQAEWELGFRFPKTVSPAEQSPANQDHRKLAVRVQSIVVTPV